MSENRYPQTPQEKEDWLKERISVCRDATRDIKEINKWALEESSKIQSLTSSPPSVRNRMMA